MLLEIVIAFFLGLIAGTITGLIPGIHTNLIAVFLISYISLLNNYFSLTGLLILITAMATTHTFMDFVPSIFLGAPEEDTFLSVLPGHQMLKKGMANEAVILTLYGSLLALAIILVFTPIFINIIPKIFELISKIFPFLLIFISLYLIFREKEIVISLTVFVLAGFLGLISLRLPLNQPLLPILTGLFGSSALIISMKQKPTFPKQKQLKIREVKVSKKELSKAILGAIISAPLCSFLPGVGAGHAAVIGSEIIEQTQKSFLILLGAINTIVIGLSFITLFSIERTRTGAALAVKEITGLLSKQDLTILITTLILTGMFSFFIALFISRNLSKAINKFDYQITSLFVLGFLTIMVSIMSGPLGIIVFLTSTSLGIYAILSGSRRINMMGVLLIPTIVFYLFS